MANKRQKKKHWKQQGGTLRCTLCGKLLWSYRGDFVSGQGGVVCRQCLRTAYITDLCSTVEEVRGEAADKGILTPQSLVEQLDRIVAGQDEAKRAVALAVWKQQQRASGALSVPAGHLLLYGPTGCGKTFLASQAAELAGLPCCVFDATTLSEAGSLQPGTGESAARGKDGSGNRDLAVGRTAVFSTESAGSNNPAAAVKFMRIVITMNIHINILICMFMVHRDVIFTEMHVRTKEMPTNDKEGRLNGVFYLWPKICLYRKRRKRRKSDRNV